HIATSAPLNEQRFVPSAAAFLDAVVDVGRRIDQDQLDGNVGFHVLCDHKAAWPPGAPHMLVRAEEQRDWAAVHAVNVAAFETPEEANLVDALREHARPIASLVAEDDGAIVGHIMFSPVTLA